MATAAFRVRLGGRPIEVAVQVQVGDLHHRDHQVPAGVLDLYRLHPRRGPRYTCCAAGAAAARAGARRMYY